jgi:Putative Ig domain
LRISESLVSLGLTVCVTSGSLGSRAQTMKIVAPGPTPKAPKPSPVSRPNGGLRLTCGTTGLEGKPFLVATAVGGTTPYTFTVPAPAGVTFNSPDSQKNGSLFVQQSSYAAEQTATFDVKVTDSASSRGTAELTCSINIVPTGPGELDVECPGTGYVNTAFVVCDVRGGAEPYTYAASPLPAPLALDKSTGIITGASTAGTVDNLTITVTDKDNTQRSKICSITIKEQPKRNLNCTVLPVGAKECVGYGAAKNANINTFWGTNAGFVFFNQIKSIYNGASNSETVSADIGTLNFPFGMQLNIGSNIQAGSVPPTAVSTGTVPTLSPSAAAQAAQNMLYGGTIYASGAYPILAAGGNRINSPGSWGGMLDVAAREGVDVQSFKAGTSTGLTSPSFHSSLQMEGYAQMNSTNLPTVGAGTFAGALFIGGSYGYSYTSHEYIRDYGIASPSNRLGQVSAGVVLNGVAKLAFSKAFGPSQTYFDGTITPTPSTPTTINNFKTWSFELSYQSAVPGSQ